MLDRVFAIIGMLGVIAFMGIVAVFVMEPDLWIVSLVVLSIGIAFFWRELGPGGRKIERKEGDGSES